jgi:hypothetical protein
MATSWTILNLSFFMPLPVDLNGTSQSNMNPQPPHGRPPVPIPRVHGGGETPQPPSLDRAIERGSSRMVSNRMDAPRGASRVRR